MRSAFVIAGVIAAALQLPGRAASGRAMSTDDLITAVRVRDPQQSPDGATVLFVRPTTDGKNGKRNASEALVLPDEGHWVLTLTAQDFDAAVGRPHLNRRAAAAEIG